MARDSRWSGWRFPPGLHVRTRRLRYASNWTPRGAAMTRPRPSRIFSASVAATPAHSSQAMGVEGPRWRARSTVERSTR